MISKPNIAETQKFGRQGRINRLAAAIKACSEAGNTADKEKIIAIHCFEWGCSRRTLLEYLNILINLDKILIIGDDIVWKKPQAV